MAITTTKQHYIPYKKLSIQVSLNGLSFCVLNQHTQTIDFLKHVVFEKQLNPDQVLQVLKDAFSSENDLKEDFKNIMIIHENELSSLVPRPLFNEDHLADYLKFNAKILKTDYIAHDALQVNDSVNVYVPYVNINNYIYNRFGEFVYKHHSSILIEKILQIEKHANKAKMYVNVSSTRFEIIVVEKGTLLLYNTFEYSTKEDFIYYILFTSEQLGLNPEHFELVFTGNINAESELYTITFKYVRFVSFLKRLDPFKIVHSEQSYNEHADFALINSF